MAHKESAADYSCQTKYPIVLIHGAGFRDLKWPVYWGRIPGVQDICDVYVAIAADLKARGL